MSKKLPIGSGMHRAKRNRSRGPRAGVTLVVTGFTEHGTPCHDCGTPLELVQDCTCIRHRNRDAFLGMASLRLRKSKIQNRKSKIRGGVH